LVALIGIAVGFIGWFRPAPHNNQAPPKPAYTDQQTADAKAKVCAAFGSVHQAVVVTNHRDHGNDPTSILAAATSARQAFDAGSDYLLTTLTDEPATPPDLAKAVRSLATVFQQLTVSYLAEVSDSALDPLLRAGDDATLTVQRLCK
jgi:hypothetical protein